MYIQDNLSLSTFSFFLDQTFAVSLLDFFPISQLLWYEYLNCWWFAWSVSLILIRVLLVQKPRICVPLSCTSFSFESFWLPPFFSFPALCTVHRNLSLLISHDYIFVCWECCCHLIVSKKFIKTWILHPHRHSGKVNCRIFPREKLATVLLYPDCLLY